MARIFGLGPKAVWISWVDPSAPDRRFCNRLDRSQVVSTVENRSIKGVDVR
ncbi:MAG: hypothetical protein ABR985_07380 [Methanotrichaceae archaeon]